VTASHWQARAARVLERASEVSCRDGSGRVAESETRDHMIAFCRTCAAVCSDRGSHRYLLALLVYMVVRRRDAHASTQCA
jgi:hypothetical protein